MSNDVKLPAPICKGYGTVTPPSEKAQAETDADSNPNPKPDTEKGS